MSFPDQMPDMLNQDGDGKIALASILKRVNTTIHSDPERWNKDWEEALHAFTAQDVFEFMRYPMTMDTPDKMSEMVNCLKKHVHEGQMLAALSWGGETSHDELLLVTIWVLSEENERRKFLMKGIEKACNTVLWKQEARVTCPEIMVAAMMKKKGRAYMDFMKNYLMVLKEVRRTYTCFQVHSG